VVQNPAILAARPDARPAGRDDSFVVDSFFDRTQHAQVLLNERFAILSSNRLNEAAEAQDQLGIGTQIDVAPLLPHVRMIDKSRGIDRSMLLKGVAVDWQVDRNSVEAVG
jgi:hypothetical protein